MEYVVDMQGFKKPGNDYVLKELAILSLNTANAEPIVFLFKPPFSWRRLTEKYKRENLWLELCYHGLEWKSGNIDYTEIEHVLRENLKNAQQIYVIGEFKQKWLEKFNFQVSDLTNQGYSLFEMPRLVTDCPHHNGSYKSMCALRNVKRMKRFYFHMDWEDVTSSEEEV